MRDKQKMVAIVKSDMHKMKADGVITLHFLK